MITAPASAPGLAALAAHGLSWFSLAAYSFVASTVIFRTTGQADYGIWATIAAFRSALLFLDSGLAFGATRDAALAVMGNAEAGRRWRAASVVYLVGGGAAVMLGVAFSWLPGALLGVGDQQVQVMWVTMLIGIEVALALAFSPVLAALRGGARFDLLAGSSLATAGIGSTLLLILTPAFGIVGAGIAVVVGRLGGGLAALAWSHRGLPGLLGLDVSRRRLSAVVRFATPMWAVAIGSAMGMATDVPIVGVIFGPTPAGAYGIGALAPSLVAGLVFILLDTAFPRLTTLAVASLGQVVRVLTTVGVLVAAIGFGALVLSAEDILTVWLGSSSGLTTAALAAYSTVWLLNVPAHVLVLAALARDQHQLIGRVVLAEAGVNIVLSVGLALAIGPLGPAIATVLSIGVSNVVVLPLLLGPKIGVTPVRLLSAAGVMALLGVITAMIVRVPAAAFADPGLRVTVHALLTATAIGIVGILVIVRRTDVQRWLGILFDGGWRVLRVEAAERKAIGPVLRNRPIGVPAVTSNPPLVTVRIATYSRGQLVADRAIASALAQTHRNLEVVVVGDRCDTATEQAVRAVRDPRVRFENLPERGNYPDDPMFRWMVAGAAPMNRALSMARGEWLAPLDDDDEFTIDHVEVLLDACRSRDLDVAYGVADMEIRPGHWEHVGSWPPGPGGIIHASVLYSLKLRSMQHSFESWRLNEPADWNLWRRMLAAGARFGFIDRVVVRHYLEYREVLAEAAR